MMIRTTVTKKRGHYRSRYDPQSLTDAYNKVLDEGLSVQRAASIYDVPVTTLKDRVRGRINVDVTKSGPLPMFSLEQEALLSGHLNTMAELGYGYSRMEAINLATDYAVHVGLRQKENPLSLKWLHNFLDRWPELRIRKPRSLEAARAKSATRPVVDKYFEELGKIFASHNFSDRPASIFNLDEKGLSTDHKPPRIVSGVAYKPQAVTSGKSQTVTVIGGGNAIGHQVPPFFIFPGKRMVDGLLAGASPGVAGTVSETGWSNTEIFNHYIKNHLSKFLPARDEKSPVLVLYDGHKSHISIGLIEWAKENHIILFVLPPHCSHLLQPLDVSCYGPFETAWNASCHNHLRESGGNVITRYDVCKIACKVYTATLTPGNIQAAFKKCGIFPFDSSVISDSLVAPSLSFARASSSASPSVSASVTNDQHNTACTGEAFLESRGGDILKNVKTAKVRNTLSRVVGGKPITNDEVVKEIKDHIQSQQSHNRKRKISPSTSSKTPSAGPSGSVPKNNKSKFSSKQPPVPLQSSSSDTDSDVSDEEKCCVCMKFCPEEMKHLPYIKFVKWGQCDDCSRWVHLQFCTNVRVIRRGDNFYCPDCTRKMP